MQVRWLSRALRNLGEEADHIAQDDPAAAARMVVLIEDAVAMLADHPGLGRPGRVPGTRELVVPGTPYLVPYRVRGQHVDILRVFHGRRRWPSQL
ncbi:type II toxin-antitoxin system RelE/ParE family toxin [Sinimarinibacterium flocculans]|uniref:type II toxin-antitoxin system RelE/ParE family toxin n=1 Tax=Sinimarinibacterium flocculans TaxID=985250 RepID=UPI002490E0A1|nr:type II toxin-antitoxin system RelE/ParE family toxin [Sinimarinibacterium flocculans]